MGKKFGFTFDKHKWDETCSNSQIMSRVLRMRLTHFEILHHFPRLKGAIRNIIAPSSVQYLETLMALFEYS